PSTSAGLIGGREAETRMDRIFCGHQLKRLKHAWAAAKSTGFLSKRSPWSVCACVQALQVGRGRRKEAHSSPSGEGYRCSPLQHRIPSPPSGASLRNHCLVQYFSNALLCHMADWKENCRSKVDSIC